jgi:hypothetical protein
MATRCEKVRKSSSSKKSINALKQKLIYVISESVVVISQKTYGASVTKTKNSAIMYNVTPYNLVQVHRHFHLQGNKHQEAS